MIARQKVLNACENCRARKVKCDARKPKCQRCAQKPGQPCIYHPRPKSRRGSAPSPSSLSQEPNAMTGDVDDSPTSTQFFGRSSASSFARQINSAINFQLDTPSSSSERTTRLPNAGKTVARSEFIMPSRAVADGLVEGYLRGVWDHFPIQDHRVFMESYEQLWNSTESHLDTFHCLLNIILALGSQFKEDMAPEERRREGQIYWQRCQQHYGNRIDLVPSLQGVQCLLWMGLFCQSTSESIMCWMTVAAAIRMAQSLGLHLISTGTTYEIEYSRRVWLGCVFMDRVTSITFGRPGMVPRWLTQTYPKMIDEEFFDVQLEESPVRPDGTPTRMAFLVCAFQLNDIFHDMLLELYINESSDEQLLAVLRFDKKLAQWSAALPVHLQYGGGPDYLRARVTLRARWLHARMVVLKPVVANFYLPQAYDGSLTDSLINSCTSLCYSTAHDLISLVWENMDLKTVLGPVPSWWYVVLFIYTAATVVLVERVRPVDDTQRPDSWDRAIKILKACSRVGEAAKRCVVALEMMDAKVNERLQPEVPYDFGMDFTIDDMMWLNSSASDLMFPEGGAVSWP